VTLARVRGRVLVVHRVREQRGHSILDITLTDLVTALEFLARVIPTLQRTKPLENLAQHCDIVSSLRKDDVRYDVIKNALYKVGHLTKAFQTEKKHDIASQLLKEYASRNQSCR